MRHSNFNPPASSKVAALVAAILLFLLSVLVLACLNQSANHWLFGPRASASPIAGRTFDKWLSSVLAPESSTLEVKKLLTRHDETSLPHLRRVLLSDRTLWNRTSEWVRQHLPASVAKWLPQYLPSYGKREREISLCVLERIYDRQPTGALPLLRDCLRFGTMEVEKSIIAICAAHRHRAGRGIAFARKKAPDEAIENPCRISVTGLCRPSGARCNGTGNPGLTPWAILGRPSGAQAAPKGSLALSNLGSQFEFLRVISASDYSRMNYYFRRSFKGRSREIGLVCPPGW